MAATSPYILRWGIMATGHIAERFAKDLLTDPTTRDVDDVRHEISAVASSTSQQKAVDFCDRVRAPRGVKTYASYPELVADPDVDIVYVATPISHHFQNVMLALQAGKPVLCEKAFTVTASQAQKLVDFARAKRLFLMEGYIGSLWTNASIISSCHKADNSLNRNGLDGKLDFDDENRMVNLGLGGGAMLDLGIYSLTWLMQILYHLQPEEKKEPPTVVAAVNKYSTGADETTSFILQFPGHKTMGIGLTTLRIASGVDYDFTGGPPIKIQGSNGEIQIVGPAFKPRQWRMIRKDGGGHIHTVDCPFPGDKNRDGWGHGMYWEADECARCVRDGKLESATLPLDESVLMMQIMESILAQGGVKYPEHIVSDVYDPESSLNKGKTRGRQ